MGSIVQFATAKLGVIMVNINPAYRKDELAFALNLVECKVTSAESRGRPSLTAGTAAGLVSDPCP